VRVLRRTLDVLAFALGVVLYIVGWFLATTVVVVLLLFLFT
jgi:hypothetical protein